MADYNGSAKVIIPTAGGTWTGGTANGSNDWVWVNFTNGVGTATLNAPSSNPSASETISSTDLYSGANGGGTLQSSINYGTASLSYASASATALSVTPAFNDVSANANTEDTVTVGLNDQAGQPMTTGTAYVTLTISGPGSFTQGGTPVTTETEYISGAGTSVPVYAIQGQTGTITVSASGTGLTTGSAAIQSVVTTAPASFTVTSQQDTTSAGVPYTLYTVQLVDANGNAVVPTNADALTLSDNTATVGGTLQYYAVSNGAPTGGALTASNGTYSGISISNSTGQAQFAVENTAAGSGAATITVADALTGTSKTAAYAFQTGSPAYALFSGQTVASHATGNGQAEAGATVNYTVQLSDSNGNALNTAGQTVDFFFSSNGASATIDGSSAWSSSNAFIATTNSNGQATVSVAIPAGASSSYTLDSEVAGQANAATTAVTVEPAATYTTQLGLNTAVGGTGTAVTPATAVTGGTNVIPASTFVVPENAVGAYTTTTDNLQFSISNSNVLSLGSTTGWTAVNGSTTEFTGTTATALPTVTAEKAGTATITVTDLSNPNMPTLTYTVTVSAGSANALSVVNPDGTMNSAYTFTANGLSGPFTVEVTDLGGNVVPATAPITLTAQEVASLLGLNIGTASGDIAGIRTSSGGADVSSVTIAQNQASVQVWVDGATQNASTTETGDPYALNNYVPALSTAASNTATTVTLTFNNPVEATATGSTLASMFSVTDTTQTKTWTPSSVTISGDTVTLTLASTDVIAHSDAITVSYTGATGGLTSGYGATVANISAAAVTNNN